MRELDEGAYKFSLLPFRNNLKALPLYSPQNYELERAYAPHPITVRSEMNNSHFPYPDCFGWELRVRLEEYLVLAHAKTLTAPGKLT
jgi:hypothetical protein